jgi:hypothetical protein
MWQHLNTFYSAFTFVLDQSRLWKFGELYGMVITKKDLEDTRTTKRGKSEKWNHFLKEI